MRSLKPMYLAMSIIFCRSYNNGPFMASSVSRCLPACPRLEEKNRFLSNRGSWILPSNDLIGLEHLRNVLSCKMSPCCWQTETSLTALSWVGKHLLAQTQAAHQYLGSFPQNQKKPLPGEVTLVQCRPYVQERFGGGGKKKKILGFFYLFELTAKFHMRNFQGSSSHCQPPPAREPRCSYGSSIPE